MMSYKCPNSIEGEATCTCEGIGSLKYRGCNYRAKDKCAPLIIDTRCIGCIYHMPRKIGGEGFQCDCSSMVLKGRCPDWVVNVYTEKVGIINFSFEKVMEYNKA